MKPLQCLTWLLLFFPIAAHAAGLPKAEEGYRYYCTGIRLDPSDPENYPNALVALKLKKEDVRSREKGLTLCATGAIDEYFVLKRFTDPNDQMLDGFVFFKVPIEIEGRTIELEFNTGGPLSYLSEYENNRFYGFKRRCGAEETPDSKGLFRIRRQGASSCTVLSYHAFPPIGDEVSNFEVKCWEGERCLFAFYHRRWRFLVLHVPEEWIPHWREIYRQAIDAIEKRLALYIAPYQCIGPLDCGVIGSVLQVPQ